MTKITIQFDTLDDLKQVFQWSVHKMADTIQALTDAVNDVATKFDTLNDTLQIEMSQIADALTNASSDTELRTAANDAVIRLVELSTKIGEMNSTVQNIIP